MSPLYLEIVFRILFRPKPCRAVFVFPVSLCPELPEAGREKGLLRQELITVITTKGVFSFFRAVISIKESGMFSQASTALSNRLQNRDVISFSNMNRQEVRKWTEG